MKLSKKAQTVILMNSMYITIYMHLIPFKINNKNIKMMEYNAYSNKKK